MKDDYLWDKSGTPDTEVEALEQLLGPLRYQPPAQGLPLPEAAALAPRRRFIPAFAVAAAAVLIMMAAGVWFTLGSGQRTGIATVDFQVGSASDWLSPESVAAVARGAAIVPNENPEPGALPVTSPDLPTRPPVIKRRAIPESLLAKARQRHQPRNTDEGIAAREQLMKALHLASSKLNQVQKKVQDTKALGPES